MLTSVLFNLFLLVVLTIVWTVYLKQKRMIYTVKEKAIYPTDNMNEISIRTVIGKAENLSFQSKSWKMKRMMVSVTTIIMLALISLNFIYKEDFAWANLFITLYLPMVILLRGKVSTFQLLPTGVYIDEQLYTWDQIKEVEVKPVKMSNKIYGLFDDSGNYTEFEFWLDDKKKSSVSVYILEKHVVHEVSKLLSGYSHQVHVE